jgi:hypothetical protein
MATNLDIDLLDDFEWENWLHTPKSVIRLKGGPTSGNYGHKGRPGLRGGSAKGGGHARIGLRAAAIEADPKFADKTAAKRAALHRLSREHRERVEAFRDQIPHLAERLGYDAALISYEGVGYPFQVGDVKWKAAGDYSPIDRHIRLYDEAFQRNNNTNEDNQISKTVLAHEVMHDKWQMFSEQYTRDKYDIDNIMREQMDKGVPRLEYIMKPDGNLRNADYENKYQSYVIMRYIEDNAEELRTKDGVTAYSRSYYQADPYSSLAINETLAEIARLDYSGHMHEVDYVWKELYRQINAIYPLVQPSTPTSAKEASASDIERIIYINDQFEVVDESKATIVKVYYKDGSMKFGVRAGGSERKEVIRLKGGKGSGFRWHAGRRVQLSNGLYIR